MGDEEVAGSGETVVGGESLSDFWSEPDTWSEGSDDAGGTGEDGQEDIQAAEDDVAEGTPEAQHGQDDDDGQEPGDEGDDAPPPESHSRMVRKLAQRERELSEHRSQLRDRDRRIAELESRLQAQQEPEDMLELVRGRMARRLGVDPKDPKVDDALFDLSRDLTLEVVGEAVNADPEMKRLREERLAERQRKAERRELESRIERMEREKVEAEQKAQRAEASRQIGEFLRASEEQIPFLMAQTDIDPVETVTELALEAVRTGQVDIRSGESKDQAVARLLGTIAQNLNGHYRRLAETLSKKLPPKDGSPTKRIDERTGRAGKASKQAPQKRAGRTGTGGGGRGTPRPSVERNDQEEDFQSFMKRELQREADLKRGRR